MLDVEGRWPREDVVVGGSGDAEGGEGPSAPSLLLVDEPKGFDTPPVLPLPAVVDRELLDDAMHPKVKERIRDKINTGCLLCSLTTRADGRRDGEEAGGGGRGRERRGKNERRQADGIGRTDGQTGARIHGPRLARRGVTSSPTRDTPLMSFIHSKVQCCLSVAAAFRCLSYDVDLACVSARRCPSPGASGKGGEGGTCAASGERFGPARRRFGPRPSAGWIDLAWCLCIHRWRWR